MKWAGEIDRHYLTLELNSFINVARCLCCVSLYLQLTHTHTNIVIIFILCTFCSFNLVFFFGFHLHRLVFAMYLLRMIIICSQVFYNPF